jgi:hypothetical protein
LVILLSLTLSLALLSTRLCLLRLLSRPGTFAARFGLLATVSHLFTAPLRLLLSFLGWLSLLRSFGALATRETLLFTLILLPPLRVRLRALVLS